MSIHYNKKYGVFIWNFYEIMQQLKKAEHYSQ